MVNKCTACDAPITKAAFPPKNWRRFNLYATTCRGKCQGCGAELRINPLYIGIWWLGCLLAAIYVFRNSMQGIEPEMRSLLGFLALAAAGGLFTLDVLVVNRYMAESHNKERQ